MCVSGVRLRQNMFHGVLSEPSTTEEGRQSNIKRASKLKHDEKNPCVKVSVVTCRLACLVYNFNCVKNV